MTNPLDDPRVGSAIFFPRPDMPYGPPAPGAADHMFDVPDGARLRLRVYPGPDDAPRILFFHGNGETARDYDALAASFQELPARLVIAEYRGYGPSSGRPLLTTFLGDAHASLDEMLTLAPSSDSSVVVMGRSLGSAPAIELASARPGDIAGLIVESGFARVVPLLELLGVPATRLGISEDHGPASERKMATVCQPTLILHAENDEIIPIRDAELLSGACADPDHEFRRVPNAGHNDIQSRAGVSYFEAIRRLLARL